MTRLLLRVATLFVLTLLSAPVVGGQTAGVTLVGTVTDETGAALPGSMVTATNLTTGFARSAMASDGGRYTVLGLPAGTYDVRVERQAFSSIVQKAQEFQVGQTITLDFKLKLGALTETIEVTAETPIVQTESSQLARVIRADELDSQGTLNRNFTDLASFAPGVSVAGNNVTIGNGPTVGTGFLVDGSSLQEPTVGGAAFQISQDWIQEFSVLVGQFPAEFGAAQNGVLNAVTRSGGNKVSGRASGYFQNDALNSNLWSATSKLPFSQQRVGLDLGGPFQKDRSFYFIGYELTKSVTNSPVSVAPFFAGVVKDLTLNAAGTAAEGSNNIEPRTHSIIAKVDYRKGNAQTFTPRLLYVKTDNNSRGGTALNSTRWSSRGFTDQLNDSYQLAWTWATSSSALLDSRIAYRRLGTLTGCFTQEDKSAPFIMTLTTLVYPALTFPAPTNVTIGCTGPWGERGEREFSINEAYTKTTSAHTFKVGGMIMRATHFGYEQQNQAGQYTMGSATSILNPAVAATYPTAYTLNYAPGDNPFWEIGGNQYSAFAQDTWRVGANLTLNYGLRWDMDAKLPSANSYVDAMRTPYNTSLNHVNTQKDEFAPRVGFTWTPTESNRLAVRGGFGVFYDESHNGTLAGWSGQIGNALKPGGLVMSVQNNSATLNPYCAGNTLCAAGVPAALNAALRQVLAFALLTNTAPNFAATSVTLNGVTTALPGLTLVPTPLSVGHIDQDIRTPYQRQATIGVQADLGHGLSGSADLKFIQGRDQYIRRNINTNLQGGFVDPLYLSRIQLGNGGELDVKQLLATFNYRSRKGHSAAASYALGQAFSNSIQDFANGAGASGAATNPFDYSVDYGPTSNDIRHVLNLNGTLEVWGGIALSPIFRIQSAQNFGVTTAGRPAPAQGCQVYYNQCYVFNSTTGQIEGRNTFLGDVTWSANARISKTVKLGAARSVLLAVEAYNLTNKVNITGYNGLANVGNATGGVITGLNLVANAAQTMRQVQIGARFDF